MRELGSEHYERVIPLVQASGMRGHLALVYELLDGQKSGRVFVDDLARPRTALVCPYSGFFFGFGDPDERQVRPLVEDFWQRQDALELCRNYTNLFGSHAGWNDLLEGLAKQLGARPSSRLAFELRSRPGELPVPAGFRLQPMDLAITNAILDGKGTGGFGLDPWFLRVGGGCDTYLTRGLGMVLMDGDQIASMCGYCGLAHGEAEMEVGTVPAYRGRGLAVIVSAAFMAQCFARGVEPAYTCDRNNLASISVAHKLGYYEIEEVRGFQLCKMNDN